MTETEQAAEELVDTMATLVDEAENDPTDGEHYYQIAVKKEVAA